MAPQILDAQTWTQKERWKKRKEKGKKGKEKVVRKRKGQKRNGR